MKIRHKRVGVVLERDFVTTAEHFVETYPNGAKSHYAMDTWEPVSEWVNVTGECDAVKEPRG